MAPDGDYLRILIADDHMLFRRGVRDIIDESEGMRVVAEAADGDEAVRLALQLRPDGLDLVLMDIEMPRLDGITATQRIVARDPALPIIMLTVSADDTDLLRAVRAGAVGFLNKTVSPTALVRALRDFHSQGSLPMSRLTTARLLQHLRAGTAEGSLQVDFPAGRSEHAVRQPLTQREREVLDLIAIGARDRDIAGLLYLTENTVKKHVKNILHKLGARNRAQAAIYYRERRGN